MKKHLWLLCSLILVLASTACGTDFDGSRTGNENEFIMDYKMLNKTDSQNLIVTEGDAIHAEIIVENGSLSLEIRKDDGLTPIYADNDVTVSDEFDVEIEESGTYIVTVTGKKAKGSVRFMVKTAQ